MSGCILYISASLGPISVLTEHMEGMPIPKYALPHSYSILPFYHGIYWSSQSQSFQKQNSALWGAVSTGYGVLDTGYVELSPAWCSGYCLWSCSEEVQSAAEEVSLTETCTPPWVLENTVILQKICYLNTQVQMLGTKFECCHLKLYSLWPPQAATISLEYHAPNTKRLTHRVFFTLENEFGRIPLKWYYIDFRKHFSAPSARGWPKASGT